MKHLETLTNVGWVRHLCNLKKVTNTSTLGEITPQVKMRVLGKKKSLATIWECLHQFVGYNVKIELELQIFVEGMEIYNIFKEEMRSNRKNDCGMGSRVSIGIKRVSIYIGK